MTARGRRAIIVMVAAVAVFAVGVGYWLGSGAPLTRTLSPAGQGPLPITVTDWQVTDNRHAWVLLNSQTDPVSRIFATDDAGSHWRALAPLGGLQAFVFRFFDGAHGVVQARDVAARSIILLTTDGGRSWRRGESPPVPFAPGEVLFADADHAFLFMEPDVFVTVDAARSWQMLPRAVGFQFLRPLGFLDGRRGWAASGPQLLRTVDGGVTWSPDQLPVALTPGTYLMRLVTAGDGTMLVTASQPGAPVPGAVYPSRTAGQVWETPRAAEPDTVAFNPIPQTAFADHDHWFVASGVTLLATADAGRTWTDKGARLPKAGRPLGDVRFTSSTDGWSLTHQDGVANAPVLMRTTDGGHTWIEVRMPTLS